MKYGPKQIAKAVVGGALAGLSAAGMALSDNVVTGPEACGIAAAVIATAGAVFGVSNAPARDAKGRFE